MLVCILYVFLYLVIGFILVSIFHKYFHKCEPDEFLAFTLGFPIIIISVMGIMAFHAVSKYLEWLGTTK